MEKSKSSTPNKKRKLSRSRSNSPIPKISEKNTTKNELPKTNKKESNLLYPEFPQKGKFKFIHWNVNGFRPLLKTNELDTLISLENPDCICFNEIKLDNETISKMNYQKLYETNYKTYFYCPKDKKGYAGTAVFTKYTPINVTYGIGISKHDDEGRVITLEYPQFYLIACYTPNAGQGLKRIGYRIKEWDEDFFKYIDSLKSKKDIILCGDLNVAYNEIDIYEPKGHEKSPGFTQLERESFKKFLKKGYCDTFRNINPKLQKFSFFTKRTVGKNMKELNKGWRLDYFITNTNSKLNIIDSDMLDKNKYNSSDHIPIKLEFEFK